jgi:2-polyprenyl-3-methyl-5-hydroxy-6-metoxy-1,4-benzoquinol methylase
VSFKQRSYQQELLDGKNIPFEDIKRNMLELDFINTHLGGHKVTLRGIKALTRQRNLSIVEIGCGGGDNLRQIKKWGIANKINVALTGIDINNECIQFASKRMSNKDIVFICSDYRLVKFDAQPDIVFSSLFCHHFDDEELVKMLQWMNSQSAMGFFINDLHRNPLAYYSIKWLTQAFSKSYMVKHDAPLSVKRGFQKKDWAAIFHKANIDKNYIKWCWAFRWLVVCNKNES